MSRHAEPHARLPRLRARAHIVWGSCLLVTGAALMSVSVYATMNQKTGADPHAPATPPPTVLAAQLTGTAWTLHSAVPADFRAVPVSKPAPQLTFTGPTAFRAGDGCHTLAGQVVTADDRSVQVLDAAQVPACSGPVKAQAATIAAVFGARARWTVSGGTLTLSSPTGTLTYRRTDK